MNDVKREIYVEYVNCARSSTTSTVAADSDLIRRKMSSMSNHADVVSDTAVDRVKLETKKFQRLLELLLSSRYHQFYYSLEV